MCARARAQVADDGRVKDGRVERVAVAQLVVEQHQLEELVRARLVALRQRAVRRAAHELMHQQLAVHPVEVIRDARLREEGAQVVWLQAVHRKVDACAHARRAADKVVRRQLAQLLLGSRNERVHRRHAAPAASLEGRHSSEGRDCF
eukprot:6746229-Prymnesium_polylepis.1